MSDIRLWPRPVGIDVDFGYTPGVYEYDVAGQDTTTRVGALPLPSSSGPIAMDTESTGLDIFAPDWRLRTVQFGSRDEAIVVPIEDADGNALPENRAHVTKLLKQAIAGNGIICHNATFDCLSLAREGLIELDEILPRVTDTRTMAHLIDPRQPQEGGIGHGLKQLCAEYVDPTAPDTQGDLTAVFRSMGMTKATGFANIPIDNSTYLLYAGLDVILTSRLFEVSWPMIQREGFVDLLRFELKILRVCAKMQYRGFLIDPKHARSLIGEFADIRDAANRIAEEYGITSVNAPKQVAAALSEMGAELTKTTKTGAVSVDSEVLERLAKEGNMLAMAVTDSKRATKWSKTYAEAMLNQRDESNRVHASINPLQARTARMSISNPPLQQLPSKGKQAWKIRSCVVASPGNVLISVDYDAIEMRVFAALAGVEPMIDAIHGGEDLHLVTSRLVFGDDVARPDLLKRWKDATDEKNAPPEYWAANAKRNVAKMANFLTVYGGGAAKLAIQAGIPQEQAEDFLRKFHAAYPEIRRFSKQLERQATFGEPYGCVVSRRGRRMPLDQHRMYAGLNYLIQNQARDILCEGILNINDAGYGDTILLPVHDELIGETAEHEACNLIKVYEDCMSTKLNGVPITATGVIAGQRWGDKYKH